jgi:hypothetical protein
MANVWVGDNYYISEIYECIKTSTDEDPNFDVLEHYVVRLQRLPEDSYPHETIVQIDIYGTANADKFPTGLSQSDFLANVLPLVNTEIASYDTSFNGTDAEAFSSTGLSKVFG